MSRLSSYIPPIIAPIFHELEIQEGDVERIVIADAAHYGAAIHRYSPTDGYTNRHDFAGVGKTLGFLTPENRVSNRIVLRAEIINGMMDPVVSTRDKILCRSVLAHELGHCRDHIARPASLQIESSLQTTFKIAKVNRRCVEAATAEYAACAFSANFVDAKLLTDQFVELGGISGEFWSDVFARRRCYSGPAGLHPLAVMTAETAWTSIMSACKVFGWRAANPLLRSQVLPWNQWFHDKGAEILSTIETSLYHEWNTYPHDLSGFQQELIRCWWRLTRSQGFAFREGPVGDGVFFNR